MESLEEQQVKLVVHLSGAIAYVPSKGKCWALMPEARVPVPSQWGKTSASVFYARASHLPMLLVDRDLIVKDMTVDDSTSTVLEKYSKYPRAEPPTVVVPLMGKSLSFDVSDGEFKFTDNFKQFFPQLAEISSRHRRASPRFNPEGDGFEREALSAYFKLNSGILDVEGFFGRPEQPIVVDFAYPLSVFGKLVIVGRVWGRKIANHLVWTAPLSSGCRQVTLTTTEADGKEAIYVFRARDEENCINISITHGEPEGPLFFIPDPSLPKDVRRLPDPDFEMIYGISSSYGGRSLRVPVFQVSSGTGGKEKPCTGGYFEEFSA